jgi:hypothetical protein
VASAYLLSEPTIFLGKCLYQVSNVLLKYETRKQLSYSQLGTGISQENGGLNQVLRRVKPPTCMTVVNSSVILTNKAEIDN